MSVKDKINVPIALSAFRDKGSRLWSFLKRENQKKVKLNCTFSTDEHHVRTWRVRQSG